MDERDQHWDARAYGPTHMRMIELPVAEVIVDPAFNCRRYTTEQIEEACAQFDVQPMLHAPTVARVEGEWRLVAGFLRFAVWQVKQVESGVFRWVESTEMRELLITNLVENLGRSDLRPHELVESFERLRDQGLGAYEIAERCRRSDRWVRRILAAKRDAHPELWAAFVAGNSPHLTLARLLDLVDHPHEVQLERCRQMLGAATRADDHARGYRELSNGEAESPPPPRRRRRLPTRRRVERMSHHIQRQPDLEPNYRSGMLDALGWLLGGGQLPSPPKAASSSSSPSLEGDEPRRPGDSAE